MLRESFVLEMKGQMGEERFVADMDKRSLNNLNSNPSLSGYLYKFPKVKGLPILFSKNVHFPVFHLLKTRNSLFVPAIQCPGDVPKCVTASESLLWHDPRLEVDLPEKTVIL